MLKVYCKKILVYCFGLFMMALGVSISKASCLGVSPVNSIPAVVSNILQVDMGICTTVVLSLFIVIQILVLRKRFKVYNLLQIIPSFLFGSFVSGANYLTGLMLPAPTNYVVSLVYIAVSVVLIAFGILCYLNAEILSLPAEGVTQAITCVTKIKLSTAKLIFDWTMVSVATILSLLCLGELDGIREGTVIAAFGVGMCLKPMERYAEKPLRTFLYGSK